MRVPPLTCLVRHLDEDMREVCSLDRRLSMFKSTRMRIVFFWLVVIIAVLIDQATKAAAIEVLEDGPKVLIPHVVNLIHVENTGAAFSIGEGANPLFIIVALVFIGAACYFVVNEKDLPFNIVFSVGMVAGGGLGNMIDRIMNGSVTDFLSFAFIDFPVFNVADMFVTVGIAYTCVAYWLFDSRRERERERERSLGDGVSGKESHDA